MVRIQLIGAVEVTVDGAPVQLPPGRSTELLAWLAAHPGLHQRARLAPIFWPDVSDATSRASLRTALWTLRKALGSADGVLTVDRNVVGLHGDDLWVDLRAARELGVDDVAGIISAAGNDVLLGVEAEWVDDVRAAHRKVVVDLLVAASERADASTATAVARRLTELDPFSEDHHRILLRRLSDLGEQATAVREHDRFRRRLWDELRVRPSKATNDLVAHLGTAPKPDGTELPSRLARASRDVFVARDVEVRALSDVLAAARAGNGPRVVLVSGEAGIGKTRLVAQFAAEAVAGGALVLFGSAAEDELLPAEPFLEAIGERHALEPHALVDLVRERVEAAAATGPVVLVLDDFHWADSISHALLRRLARTSARHLMVVAAHRTDGEGRGALAGLAVELAREGVLDRIDLAPMTRDEASMLLSAADPGGRLASQVDRLHADTGGNPLFLHELGRYLLDVPQVGARGSSLPDTVRDVVIARVQKLTATARDVLAAAAVLGGRTDVALLQLMIDADALEALDEAVAAGLLDEPSAGTHVFRHAVVREAIDADLSKSRRAELHRRAAEAIVDIHGQGDGPHLCEIAEHLCAASRPEAAASALGAARAAAEWAISNHAYDRAVVVLTKALPLADEATRRSLTIRRAVAYQRLTHELIDLDTR